MKKYLLRTASILIVAAMLLGCFGIGAAAVTYKAGTNEISDSYAGSTFYANFQKIELTGDDRTDCLAVALSQLGYKESNTSGDYAGTTDGSRDYTEYCYNMGDYGEGYSYEWCATFCSWSLLQSECTTLNTLGDICRLHQGDIKYIWREVSCVQWANQLELFGYYKPALAHGGNYKPQPADLIFFYVSGAINHIGLVLYADDNYVYTVEGNSNKKVSANIYALNDANIAGYGALPYQTDSNVQKIDYSGATRTTGYYTLPDASKYLYSDGECTEDIGVIPQFTMLEVTEVCSNGKLKVKTKISDGTTKEGYVNPAEARMIQITSNQAVDSDLIEAKTNLQSLVESVESASFKDYTEETLIELRREYKEAVAVLENADSQTEDFKNAYDSLNDIYTNTANNPHSENGISFTNINSGMTNGACIVYTSDFGTVAGTNAYHTMSLNVHLKWDSDANGYKVISVANGYDGESEVPDYNLADDEIVITAHDWETGINNPVVGSADNMANLLAMAVEGNVLVLSGVDLENGKLEIAPYAYLSEQEEPQPDDSSDVVEDSSDVIEDSSDVIEESSDVIEESSDVIEESSDVVEESSDVIEESSDVVEDSSDVIDDSSDDTSSDEESKDEENKDNEDILPPPVEKSDLGDINQNGKIDMTDYILLKRAYFGTYTFSEEQNLAGDINQNGKIDMTDYILLKRVYFGTYTLK